MTRQRRLMVCLFIFAAFSSLVFFMVNRPRVLIIESESAGSHRSREFKAGWEQTMRDRHLIAKVSWYSLEQDLQPDSDTQTLGALRSVEREDPDLVILVDDVANERVGRIIAERNHNRLLFIGIDQSPEYYGYASKTHISGVVEQLSLEPFHELLEILNPGVNLKYGVIGINNPSGRARLEQIKGCPWSQHVLSDAMLVNSFSQWQEFVLSHQDLDVLLVLNIDSLGKGAEDLKSIPASEIVNWTEVNSKPLPIGVEANYVANGGGLAFELSPRHFGEMASNRAKEWIDPSHATPPELIHTAEFQVALCRSRLSARGLTVPSIYEESARLSGTLFP
ncbi:MAG: hypothetical protein RLZ25_332 [Pseudomonadota bacterium]|jgi:hypothetical protein